MRSGALLAFIPWLLVLAESTREIQSFDVVDSNALSNVELLIPLLVQASTPGERYDRAQLEDNDDDKSFSSIPGSAFTIDDNSRVSDDAPPAHTSTLPRGSRKRELAYRPRSTYLDSLDSGERVELVERGTDIWRTCTRLTRSRAVHSHYHLLLILCAELLDGVLPPPAPPASDIQGDCCRQDGNLPWFGPVRGRRDLMPMGDNSDIRPPPRWTQE